MTEQEYVAWRYGPAVSVPTAAVPIEGIGKRLKKLHKVVRKLHVAPLKMLAKAHTAPLKMVRKKAGSRFGAVMFGPGAHLLAKRMQGRRRRRRPRRTIPAVPLAPFGAAPLAGSPMVAMPFPSPGLQGMWEAQLGEIEGFKKLGKRLKKGLKKVVKSKLFKIAAIGAATYFTAGAAGGLMAKMGAGGMKGKGLAKIGGGLFKKLGKRARKIRKPAAALLTTRMLTEAAPPAPGSVAYEAEYQPPSYEAQYQPGTVYGATGPSYTPEVLGPEQAAEPARPGVQLAGAGAGMGNLAVLGIGAIVLLAMMGGRRRR